MARMSKIEQARWDGFNRACRVAKEQGVDGLLEEQKRRGISGISIAIDRETIRDIADQIAKNAIYLSINTGAMVLHDKFDFGHKRIQRWLTEYTEVVDSVDKELLSHQDIETALKNEAKIDFSEYVNLDDIRLK